MLTLCAYVDTNLPGTFQYEMAVRPLIAHIIVPGNLHQCISVTWRVRVYVGLC